MASSIDVNDLEEILGKHYDGFIVNEKCDDCGRKTLTAIEVCSCADFMIQGYACCTKTICSDFCVFLCNQCGKNFKFKRGLEDYYNFSVREDFYSPVDCDDLGYFKPKNIKCKHCGSSDTTAKCEWNGYTPSKMARMCDD